MRILGVDPSLTATGCAIVDTDDVLAVETWTIPSRTTGGGIAERLARIDKAADGVVCVDTDLVLIEAPAYDSRTGKQHERSGLWWLIVDRFDRRGVPVVEVTTGGIKRYATGRGNAQKEQVLLAVARRYPHVDITDNNQADALVLAAMGARKVGHPIDQGRLPIIHETAMGGVAWPDLRRVTR